jgi:flagellar motor switch protein FliG
MKQGVHNVVLSGKQKAAMLLMGMDAMTAAELLKGVSPDAVQELAVELAYLDASGLCNPKQSTEVAAQFCTMLETQTGFHCKSFLDTMLKSTLGQDKADQIQTQIGSLLRKRDPFISIRSTDVATLAAVLEKEHPQATAVVLSELAPKKSSEILNSFDEGVQLSTVSRMAEASTVSKDAKQRIAEMVCERLESFSSEGEGVVNPDQSLRQVAMILRNLGKDIREGLLKAIQEKDSDVADKVALLMVVWDDIPSVADRSLQQALRDVDSQKIALALVKAEEGLVSKIKGNLSERAVTTIEEEMSLMSAPKQNDILEGRELIVSALREMNDNDELNFIEE